MASQRARRQAPAPRKRGSGPLAVLAAIVAFVLVAAGSWLVISSVHKNSTAPKDLAGNPVQFEPGNSPDPSTLQQMQVRDGDSGRLKVPAVGLDVPLGSMLTVNNVINPPGFAEAYWVRNLGVALDKPATGTVYIVTHSVSKGMAPGNYLLNANTGGTSVKAGDVISVNNTDYVTQSWKAVSKPDLPNASDLWSSVPGRLVLITCLEEPDGSFPDNLVIIAQLK